MLSVWNVCRKRIMQFFKPTRLSQAAKSNGQSDERCFKNNQKFDLLRKIESGQWTVTSAPLNVSVLVDRCWQPLAEKAAAAKIVFENHLREDIVCCSDEEGLSIVFTNLLENAVEYTNCGGRIWVTAQKKKNAVEVIFENTGNQLTEEQIKRVFEPHWRGDMSGTGDGRHFGLGLALAEHIVDKLGMKIAAEVVNGLFSVRIYMP